MSPAVHSLRPFLILFVIALLGGSASIGFLSWFSQTRGTPEARAYPAQGLTMEGENATMAMNLFDRGVFSRATTSPYAPDAWRTPGYPLFIGTFYALTGSFYPALFAQVLISFLSAALLFIMVRRYAGERWALGIAIAYLVLPDTFYSTSLLLVENLSTFLMLAGIYIALFRESGNEYLRLGAAGLLFAAATYVRPSFLYLPILFIPAYVFVFVPWRAVSRKHVVAALLFIALFAGTLLPWYLRNERVFGIPTFTSTGADVMFRENIARFYASLTGMNQLQARYALEKQFGISEGPAFFDPPSDRAKQEASLSVIIAHPIRYALFHATGFIPFLTGSGARMYSREVHNMIPGYDPALEPALTEALNPFSWRLLGIDLENHGWFLLENAFWIVVTLLAFLGLRYAPDRRMIGMVLIVIAYLAIVSGPIGYARYRIPVDPLLLLAAGTTLAALIQTYRERREKSIA